MLAVLVLVLAWAALHAVDAILRYVSTTYSLVLERLGIQITLCSIRCRTSALNRITFRIAKAFPRLTTWWFTAGTVFGVAAMLLAPILLVSNVFAFLIKIRLANQQDTELTATSANTHSDASTAQSDVLVPMVPGVTLPGSDLLLFIVTLLLTGLLHELGHAVAAVNENVRLQCFGVFCMCAYVGAFVELQTDRLAAASPLSRLRIFCAGVWHNFVLALGAAALLWWLPSK